VLVVEVDVVGAQPLERRVARPADVLGAAVHAEVAPVLCPLVPELGGQLHLLPPSLDGAPDQALVGERAVHVGRVEEIHAEVEGAVDGGDGFVIVPAGVELRHAHAAEAEGGDGEVVGTDGAMRELGHEGNSKSRW
jgi:hypothetical protein